MLLRRRIVPIAILVMAIAVSIAAFAVMLASFVFIVGQVRQWRADRGGERERAEFRQFDRSFGREDSSPGGQGARPFGIPGIPGIPGMPQGPGGQRPGGAGGAVLGVSVEPADGGLTVRSVVPNSAAAAAGVREGDLIVKAGGKDVRDIEALRAAIATPKPGEAYDVVVRRGGNEQTLQVRKPGAAAAPGPGGPGMMPGNRGGTPPARSHALPSIPSIPPLSGARPAA